MTEDGRPGLAWIAAAVIGAALAATFASLWIGARGTEPSEVDDFLSPEVSEIEDVATRVIDAITTYDSDSIDDRRAELLELSVGAFRDDYEELLAGGLGDVLEEEAASSEGEIVDGPDVGFSGSGEAIAVARVVQDVTSRGTPGGRTVFLVVKLELTLTGDEWKASSLKILSQQIL